MNSTNTKSNILFVNSIGKNKWGGGENWMLNTAKGLHSIGNYVTIASFKDSIISKKATEQGLDTFSIKYRTDFSPLNSFRIKRILEEKQYDIVICNLNRDVRVVGLASHLMKDGPKIISRQGVQLIKKKWKYKATFTKLADGILTNTFSLKNLYDSYGWWDNSFVKVIYNGFKPSPKHTPFDYNSVTKIKPSTKVILSAGRLDKQKGFEYFIEAAKYAKNENLDWKFFIAGEGKMYAKLNRMINHHKLEKHVFLLGFQNNLNSLFKNCDVFVLSSLYEGMPNVLIEAMNSGTPVVSTPANGAAELVTNNENGLIIPFKDAKAIHKSVNYMVSNADDANRMALAGQQHIKTNFLFEEAIKKVDTYIKEIIRK